MNLNPSAIYAAIVADWAAWALAVAWLIVGAVVCRAVLIGDKTAHTHRPHTRRPAGYLGRRRMKRHHVAVPTGTASGPVQATDQSADMFADTRRSIRPVTTAEQAKAWRIGEDPQTPGFPPSHIVGPVDPRDEIDDMIEEIMRAKVADEIRTDWPLTQAETAQQRADNERRERRERDACRAQRDATVVVSASDIIAPGDPAAPTVDAVLAAQLRADGLTETEIAAAGGDHGAESLAANLCIFRETVQDRAERIRDAVDDSFLRELNAAFDGIAATFAEDGWLREGLSQIDTAALALSASGPADTSAEMAMAIVSANVAAAMDTAAVFTWSTRELPILTTAGASA